MSTVGFVKTASDFVPHATSGNETSIDIDATPASVWESLLSLRSTDLKVTTPLLGIRSLPSLLSRKGALTGHERAPSAPLLESMLATRFVELDRDAPSLLTIGVIGQFWKLNGGTDVAIEDAAAFEDFDQPGFIKTAIDFTVQPSGTGSRVRTCTRNVATDAHAAKMFRRYWRVVGPGSKVIRVDMLRALKRRAERELLG